MKIFISWSGQRSGRVAEILRDWLKKVIQAAEPWLSRADIEKGANWPIELFKSIEDCNLAIVCLVPGNTESPWLLFESGAISKKIGSRVWTFLLNLNYTDITGPLAFFQHTTAEKEDVFGLVKAINSNLENPLDSTILRDVFEKWWPDLEHSLQSVPHESTSPISRPQGAVLDEILETVRRTEYGQAFLEATSSSSLLRKYIATTTPRQEKVFRLIEGFGEKKSHTFDEAAKELRLTPNEVKKSYSDALKRLAMAGFFKSLISEGGSLDDFVFKED
ncbi:MAG: TIR domain-containing protein [Desulfobacteraceae bacterium]|nr:TIR domain-containing protein [Desulfobacteraceae bacterium]